MKVHVTAVALLAIAAVCMAIPQSKRRQAYNEARLSNEVLPGAIEIVDETSQEVITTTTTEEIDEAQVSTTKEPALDDAPTPRPGNKKKKQHAPQPPASDTFSRVIDDIFNIPISVLRAVNTLISNAFGTKQATASSTATASSVTA